MDDMKQLVHHRRTELSRRRSKSGWLLAQTLIRLGPLPVKFGQVLSTRVDLVSAPVRAELSPLHDRVPTPKLRHTRRTLDASLGAPASEMVLDADPIGSGSIAVVHRAQRGDEEYAVKIRRPGIIRAVRRDAAVFRLGGRAAAQLPRFRGLPVREVVEQVADGLVEQTDFCREADHLRALGVVAERWNVHVPQPLDQLCTASVLTTAYVCGLDPGEWSASPPKIRERGVEVTMNFVYDALFGSGLVHADMHPGNLYLRAGQVIVLDGGMVYELSEFARRAFLAFFLSFATGDGPTCASIVWRSATRSAGAPGSKVDFSDEMAELISEHSGRPAQDFSLAEFSTHLFDLQRRFGLTAGPEFALPVLALLVVEGTVREHHPALDFQKLAIPHLLRATFALQRSDEFGDAIWRSN